MKLLTDAEKDRRAARRVVRAQKRFERRLERSKRRLSLKRTGWLSGSARDRRKARRGDLHTP